MHGGDSYSKTSIYETTTNAWTPSANLQIGRGYQVSATTVLTQLWALILTGNLSLFSSQPHPVHNTAAAGAEEATDKHAGSHWSGGTPGSGD